MRGRRWKLSRRGEQSVDVQRAKKREPTRGIHYPLQKGRARGGGGVHRNRQGAVPETTVEWFKKKKGLSVDTKGTPHQVAGE